MNPPVSAVIIAGNEEHNIRACLASVAWTDQIVVVHSSHDDRTADIAREFGAHVVYRDFDSYSGQRRFALSLATHAWVLSIDADERVTASLADEIRGSLADARDTAGFRIPRKGYFLGKWLRHGGWWPDLQLRLFLRDAVTVSTRLVHEGYLVEGPIADLTQPLDHHTDPTIHHHLRKNLEYTFLEARERRKRVRPRDLLLHPLAAFFRVYIGLGGWRDGAHGLAAALIHAAYNLQQYLYMWEMGLGSGGPKGTNSSS